MIVDKKESYNDEALRKKRNTYESDECYFLMTKFIDHLDDKKITLEDFKTSIGNPKRIFDKSIIYGNVVPRVKAPLKKVRFWEWSVLFGIRAEDYILEQGEQDTFFDKNNDRIKTMNARLKEEQSLLLEKKAKKETLTDDEQKILRKKIIPLLQKKDYLTREYSKTTYANPKQNTKNPAIDISSISLQGMRSELKKAYLKVSDKVGEATQKIEVHTTLIKGNNNKPGMQQPYVESQILVFDKIEEILKRNLNPNCKTKVKYTRIFSLSHKEAVIPVYDDLDCYKTFADQISPECLKHLLLCNKDYHEYCSFSILQDFSRFRTHCIIDDRFLITEDYVMNKDGQIVPRVIYIDRLENSGEFLKILKTIEEDTAAPTQLIEIDIEELSNELKGMRKTVGHLLIVHQEILKRFEIEMKENKNDNDKIYSKVRHELRFKVNSLKKRLTALTVKRDIIAEFV